MYVPNTTSEPNEYPSTPNPHPLMHWFPDHRRSRPPAIHTLPNLQRNRPTPPPKLRRRKRRKLHHRLCDGRVLPPPRILHSQRCAAVLPHPLETLATIRHGNRIPRERREHARRRVRNAKHHVHTTDYSSGGDTAVEPFACGELFESAGPCGSEECSAGHGGCGDCVFCLESYKEY
jgi:hypothetical protein